MKTEVNKKNLDSLLLNDRVFSLDEIKEGIFDTSVLNDFEKNTLNFCRDWLSGKENFSVNTSGSTGIPKTIKIKRNQMIESASQTSKALGLKRGDVCLVCMNTEYIGGKMMLVRAMETGMKMIIVNPVSNPLKYIKSGIKIDFTALVPLQMSTIVKEAYNKEVINGMKAIIL